MKLKPAYILLTAVLILAAHSIPTTQADETFGQLVVADDLSPEQRVTTKKELTESALAKAIEKTQTMQASLEELDFAEDSPELELKKQYLSDVAGYMAFYKEQERKLQELSTLEKVDALIGDIITYREEVYAPSAKKVLEFILVFSYSPSVLDTARERFNNIKSDVERLETLELIEGGQFTETLEQANLTINEVDRLQKEAQALLVEIAATTAATSTEALFTKEATTTLDLATAADEITADAVTTTTPASTAEVEEPAKITATDLAEESLNKIKGLYEIFMETGERVKQLIGI